MMIKTKIESICGIAFWMSLSLLSGCDKQVYTLEKIGYDHVSEFTVFRPWTLNNDDTIVGLYASINGGSAIYENGEFVDRPDVLGYAYDINQHGSIVGGRFNHAFISIDREATLLSDVADLSEYQYSALYGVNTDNIAVGSLTKSGLGESFIFDNNEITKISPCPAEYSSGEALDINDNGTIVGYCATSGFAKAKGFVRYHGELLLLDFIESDWLTAVEVNEHDTVVGSFIGPDELYHGFKYYLPTGEYTDLGIIDTGGYLDINNNGVTIILGDNHNYIHTDKRGLKRLSDLLKPHSFQNVSEITGINDDGKIVGYGLDENGRNAGFILTPDANTIYAGQ